MGKIYENKSVDGNCVWFKDPETSGDPILSMDRDGNIAYFDTNRIDELPMNFIVIANALKKALEK